MARYIHRGHIIAPSVIDGFNDFMVLSNFTVHGNGSVNSSTSALDAIHLDIAFNGYAEVDAFFTINNVDVVEASRDGLYYNGRGENIISNFRSLNCRRHGIHMKDAMDSTFVALNSGGNRLTGFKLDSLSSSRLVGCKAFYNGRKGAAVAADCVNWHLYSSNVYSSSLQLVGCEAQESRGSGVLVETGYCMLDMRIADPGRSSMIAAEPDPLPAVRAGLEFKGANAVGNDVRVLIKPDLGVWEDAAIGTTQTEVQQPNYQLRNWGYGTNAVHLDGNCEDNSGRVRAMKLIDYPTGAGAVGGSGATNGKNTDLRVNGAYLT